MKLILMMALSVDGIIAKNDRHFPDWTCAEDKKLFKLLTQDAGVLIMGARTYSTIGRPLPGRLNVVYTRHPERCPGGENVYLTCEEPEQLLSRLAGMGYETAVLAGGATVNSLFVAQIDEILVTLSPKIFGQGLSLFAHAVELDLALLDFKSLNTSTLLLHYRVIK